MSERDGAYPRGQESGADYLKRIAEEYRAYTEFLPGISDGAFEYQKHMRRDLDVGGFLADFALGAEERRRNIIRWQTGEKLPQASEEKLEAISRTLPAFVRINREALGGISVETARRFKIDRVAEDIMTEIVKRLPRTIDSYRFHQDYAGDEIFVMGLGKIKVVLDQSGDGLFTTVFTVEGSNFRIHNCRQSGIKYLDRFNDISRPNDIEIKPKKLLIELYDDDSGTYVTIDNKKFTNSRVDTRFGRGYSDDYKRDQMYRSDNYRAPEKQGDWRHDETELSWRKIEEEAIVWLADNVLNPIKRMPLPTSQIDIPPMEEPFPGGKIGPLYAFIQTDDLERIEILKHGVERAYPDERYAAKPSWRLIPLGYDTKGLPEVVHDGFIWCGVGSIDSSTDMKSLRIADRQMDTWSVFSGEGLAEIKLLTATDIYIIDWQAYEDYRNNTFTEIHTELTNREVGDMYRAVGKTLVPITEYSGKYKKPIVLIGRNLEVSEIGNTFKPKTDR